MRPIPTSSVKITPAEGTTTAKATFSPPSTVVQRSPWHSPVPYLFGGLAAMLGLIAFALLILACSYWKLSGVGESDVEGGDAAGKGENGSDEKASPVFEERFLVIMAGEVKPTYLAMPAAMSASASKNYSCCKKNNGNNSDGDGNDGKVIEVKVNDHRHEELQSTHEDDDGHESGEQSRASQERSH